MAGTTGQSDNKVRAGMARADDNCATRIGEYGGGVMRGMLCCHCWFNLISRTLCRNYPDDYAHIIPSLLLSVI